MTTTLFYHTHFFDVGSCTRFLQISSEPPPRRGVGDARSPRCRYVWAVLGATWWRQSTRTNVGDSEATCEASRVASTPS
jgi:hypothetical protein